MLLDELRRSPLPNLSTIGTVPIMCLEEDVVMHQMGSVAVACQAYGVNEICFNVF